MNKLTTIDAFTAKHALLSPNQTIIVGLSGGPDSVFLLYYLISKRTAYKLTIIAAHLNHEWRESAQIDADFCTNICNELNIKLISKKISELGLSLKPNGSKEQDARLARRAFFSQLIHEYAADAVALAHHKNDQEETFFIRLFRGASLSGLTGIRPKNEIYIRPLLCISKTDILTWLIEENINYAIDPTNESHDYLRNRIRHTLMPALNLIDSRFSNSFTNTLKRLQETEQFLTALTKETFDNIALIDSTHNGYLLDKQAFLSLHPVMQHRILVYWFALEKIKFPPSHAFLNEIMRFLAQPENKKHAVHASWRLIKTKKHLYIAATDRAE